MNEDNFCREHFARPVCFKVAPWGFLTTRRMNEWASLKCWQIKTNMAASRERGIFGEKTRDLQEKKTTPVLSCVGQLKEFTTPQRGVYNVCDASGRFCKVRTIESKKKIENRE